MAWMAVFQRAQDILRALPVEKMLLLVGAIWVCVSVVMAICDLKWEVFRRHGLSYWTFQFVLGFCALLVVIESWSVVSGLLFSVRDPLLAGSMLLLIIFSLVGLYVVNDLRESDTLDRSKIISMFVWPLLPTGGAIVLSHAF